MKLRLIAFWTFVPVFSWCMAKVAMSHLYWSMEAADSTMGFLWNALPVAVVAAGLVLAWTEIRRYWRVPSQQEPGPESVAPPGRESVSLPTVREP